VKEHKQALEPTPQDHSTAGNSADTNEMSGQAMQILSLAIARCTNLETIDLVSRRSLHRHHSLWDSLSSFLALIPNAKCVRLVLAESHGCRARPPYISRFLTDATTRRANDITFQKLCMKALTRLELHSFYIGSNVFLSMIKRHRGTLLELHLAEVTLYNPAGYPAWDAILHLFLESVILQRLRVDRIAMDKGRIFGYMQFSEDCSMDLVGNGTPGVCLAKCLREMVFRPWSATIQSLQ